MLYTGRRVGNVSPGGAWFPEGTSSATVQEQTGQTSGELSTMDHCVLPGNRRHGHYDVLPHYLPNGQTLMVSVMFASS